YIENIQNGLVQISCDASYKREKILRDYKATLKKALLKSSGRNYEIEINLREKGGSFKEKYQYHDPSQKEDGSLDLFSAAEKEHKQKESALKNAQLNPKYLFSNFIVGSNNRLAEAIAEAVVE